MGEVDDLIARLSTREKCDLVGGETNWRTRRIERVGIPALKMTDGPTGVRGEGHGGTGTPGVAMPSGITLGATWDTALLAEIGDLLGREATRKGAHVLLGPTVNLHRTPIGGRTFECYSEDPELSGALAASYVRGVQAHRVATTVKHFVGNDTEVDRMTVDVDIDERTLREVYLRPFERAVVEGGAWGIMSAYNQLDGSHCAHNRRLLTEILRDEWGFDGFVVSDWFGAHETVAAARAGLSIEMPGPPRIYGEALAAALERGDVSEATLDGLVRDVLVAIERTGAAERDPDRPEIALDDPAERALTRRAAVSGTVLLRNEPAGEDRRPVLPFDVGGLGSLAVIGPNAVIDRSMGGGSASLTPFAERSFLDAVVDRLGSDCAVTHAPGARTGRLAPVADGDRIATPDGEPGIAIEYFNGSDWDAPTEAVATAPSTMLRFFGTTPTGIDPREFGVRVRGRFVPEVDGPHTFGVVSTGAVTATATAAGAVTTIVDDPDVLLPRSREFFGYGSVEVRCDIDCRAGEPVEIAARWVSAEGTGFAALRIGVQPPETDDLIGDAVAAATASDAVIVMVGTDDEWETEGFDREQLELPGRQDELIERVVAANPNTAVIVNAGSPVAMGWAAPEHPRPAPAVLTSFFAGQEQAEALVDVVLGEADPGGRLPTTFPKRLADTPAFLDHRPDHDSEGGSTQRYAEGLFVGYRWYDARQIEPMFPFGHGLSYGEAEWGSVAATPTTVDVDALGGGALVTASLPVTATGARSSTVVVQGYVAALGDDVVRPPKELATWAKHTVGPGETVDVVLTFGIDAFRYWDTAQRGWRVRPGDYDLVIARSATDVHDRIRVTVTPSTAGGAAGGPSTRRSP